MNLEDTYENSIENLTDISPNMVYMIYVDSVKFILSEKTLNNFPDSPLKKALFNEYPNDRIILKKRHTINLQEAYIDVDSDSFTHVISYIRGYDIPSNEILLKVKKDMVYFLNINLDDQTGGSNNEDNDSDYDIGELVDEMSERSDESKTEDVESIHTIYDSETEKQPKLIESGELSDEISDKLSPESLLESENFSISVNSEDNNIEKLIKKIDRGLKNTDSYDLMNAISVDRNINRLVKKFNKRYSDSME